MTNTYLKYQSPGMQFMAFIGLAAGFFILNFLISSLFFTDLSDVLLNKNAVITPEIITNFKWAQLAGTVVSFVVPALLFGYFSSPALFRYIGFQPRISTLLLALSVILLFAVQPFAGWLGTVNSKINFGSMQKFFQDTEAVYNRAIQSFLKMRGPGDLIINLFVMALLPAVGEELFFRGAFQKALVRWVKIPWAAILISSSVFALLHFTPFKFLPIFALGIMLGTVYYVTGNIWYNIIIHFLNNAMAVLAVYYGDKSATLKKLTDDSFSPPVYVALLSVAAAVGIIYLMKRKSVAVLPAGDADEDNDYIA